MLEKILAPLVLVNMMNEVKGKTRFQKLMFLVQKNTLEQNVTNLDYDFKLHHYGPFSAELSSIIESLVNRNYLQEDIEATPSGYLRYTYRLTPDGKELVKGVLRKELIPSGLVKIITKSATLHGNLSLDLLVEIAYEQFLRSGSCLD